MAIDILATIVTNYHITVYRYIIMQVFAVAYIWCWLIIVIGADLVT